MSRRSRSPALTVIQVERGFGLHTDSGLRLHGEEALSGGHAVYDAVRHPRALDVGRDDLKTNSILKSEARRISVR